MFFSRRDNVVKTLESIGAVVDVATGGVQILKVYLVWIGVGCWWNSCNITESPDTSYFVFTLSLSIVFWVSELIGPTSAISVRDLSTSALLLKCASHHELVPFSS